MKQIPLDTSDLFETVFKQSRVTPILLLDAEGKILKVNSAFMSTYGYSCQDLEGKQFNILFINEDRIRQLPESELERVLTNGFALDNNYILHKSGAASWTSGETILYNASDGTKYLVKLVHEIHTQKLLERFLAEANSIINSIFAAAKNAGIFIMDKQLKITRFNEPLLRILSVAATDLQDKIITNIRHPFFHQKELIELLRQAFKKENAVVYPFEMPVTLESRKYILNIQPVDSLSEEGKRLVLVLTRDTGE